MLFGDGRFLRCFDRTGGRGLFGVDGVGVVSFFFLICICVGNLIVLLIVLFCFIFSFVVIEFFVCLTFV